MRFLHWLLARMMRPIEERMIRRLLRQRELAWNETDRYRVAMGMRIGEFLPGQEKRDRASEDAL